MQYSTYQRLQRALLTVNLRCANCTRKRANDKCSAGSRTVGAGVLTTARGQKAQTIVPHFVAHQRVDGAAHCQRSKCYALSSFAFALSGAMLQHCCKWMRSCVCVCVFVCNRTLPSPLNANYFIPVPIRARWQPCLYFCMPHAAVLICHSVCVHACVLCVCATITALPQPPMWQFALVVPLFI